MRQIHIANAGGRDATVTFATPKTPPTPKLGLPGQEVEFRRYLVATPGTMHTALEAEHGDAYGDALVAGDPEVDLEVVGRRFVPSARVYLTSKGDVMHALPNMVEVVLNPDGSERERRAPDDRPANVNAELPVRWTGKTMKKRDAVRRFAFTRTVALSHVDGLSFDFLAAMAKELAASDEVVLLGGGSSGKEPLVLQENGSPYRAFLEGRVDGDKFALLLHLSHLELKRPAPQESKE
jgi:hypothetical protein